MKGQALLIDAIITFLLLSIILLLLIPVHQDVGPLVKRAVDHDRITVALETGKSPPPCQFPRYSNGFPICRG